MGELRTIGVYGFDEVSFLDGLMRDGITMLLDVRQRRGVRGPEYAWANSQRLQSSLAAAGIAYRHHRELAPTTELRQLQYAEDARQGVGKRSRRELAASYVSRYIELGYMQLDRRGAELLFQVLTEREEKASVAIASNESFGGWTKTFADPRLCAAIVDRLTFGGTILETGTDSYRLAQAAKQRTT